MDNREQASVELDAAVDNYVDTLDPQPRIVTADLLRTLKLVLETRRVPVPEFGEGSEVVVSEMTAAERDSWETSIFQVGGKKGGGQVRRSNFRATLLVRCLVDDTGQRLLRDNEAAVLGRLGAQVISRLWDVAAAVNGITDDDEERALRRLQKRGLKRPGFD